MSSDYQPHPGLEINRRTWDAWAPLHFESPFYGVEDFRRGGISLPSFDLQAVGTVEGIRLLHLQCHFGMDTLSWRRLGAEVTGVDFSSKAIHLARHLANECGLVARFLEADVYDTPRLLNEEFDLVVTTAGVLPWLPDISRWARVVAAMLRPGGRFYLREFHPFGQIFGPDRDPPGLPSIRYPYFPVESPIRESGTGTYAAPDSSVDCETCEWSHPVSAVIQALLASGLSLTAIAEFPFTTYQAFPWLECRKDGLWYWPGATASVPLMYSLQAQRPGGLT